MFLPKFYLRSFALLLCSSLGTLAYRKAFYENNPLKIISNYHQTNGNRSAKYLFPFALINFAPEPCAAPNQQANEGVCLSKKRCSGSGGDAVGSCQQGMGTCCKFTKQCSAGRRTVTVVETVENLVSDNAGGSCVFVFPKQAGICQVRLDFTSLTLQEPQTMGPNAGNCQADSLTVSGASNIFGTLRVCGSLTGQHMILSYGVISDMISITLQMAASPYNIRATQIACNAANRVPGDCLQYFDSTTAAIKSFAFPRQLNNQQYTICVRPTTGGNTLTWDRCTNADAGGTPVPQRFQVSVPTPANAPCPTDWIAINNNNIFCGQNFPVMTTPLGNFARIRVNFDENETGNDIFYVRVPTLINAMDNYNNLGPQTPEAYCNNAGMTLSVAPRPNSNPPPMAPNNMVGPGFVFPPQPPPVLPPPPPPAFCELVVVDMVNMCMCRFSNDPRWTALAFELEYALMGDPDTFTCPEIQGFTASPPTVARGTQPVAGAANVGTPDVCKYYANVRVTDTGDTGFCLRYTAP